MLAWIPRWIIGAVIIIVPAIAAVAAYQWFTRRLIRLGGGTARFFSSCWRSGQRPASAAVLIIVAGLALRH